MAVRWAEKELTGWGRVARAASRVARPERIADLSLALMDQGHASVLAYGAGRSYGDAALNAGGLSIDTSRLDRMLELSAASGTLVAECGVTFGDLVRTLLPHGFMPPVVPGTGFATLGGGIANDVHGKNHHRHGSLAQHIAWIDLRMADGRLQRVSLESDETLFRATMGGIGLTGLVERAALRLQRVPSNAVRVRSRRVGNLDEHLSALVDEQARGEYVVGWIDALARGSSFGRGILESADPSPEGVDAKPRAARSVPFEFPSVALRPMTVRLFNQLYFHRIPKRGTDALMPYSRFLFPLDAIHRWNRIYGRRGFHQFQCVVPPDGAEKTIRLLLEKISSAGTGSFLAVLKSMGPAGVGYLSFAQPGFTLAVDFPNEPPARPLLAELERIAGAAGGRIYLAKDDTVSAAQFATMYPSLPQFRSVLERVDPTGRFQSDMSRRLNVRGDRP